ncbi:flagellar motor stator protein MotA [Jeotgalibacillus proteolyticus]|uniref:Flagellar motor protein MotA n=1 Tax=Jeotgalibacillus proteolyticus TaxID=2082395 RepID=A0A2S5G7D7_9BACL|nr:flagellar motor stator protein MotA [Jeotgalibacillus proteolyticus]PPA68863.1 flagellar motor protein MotA [Jeotgalibacillus proteolyticus]
MDKSTVFGIVFGFLAIGIGIVLKGVDPGALLNGPALLIIVLGTVASVTIAFPMSELKRVPALFGILFKEKKSNDVKEVIRLFGECAEIARKEGLLALESKTIEIEDPFLKNGLGLAIDGQNADYIGDVLAEEVNAMEDRHLSGAAIFSQAGTYAPTLGVLGAVVGLIAALGDMNDTDALGHAISAAFIATLLGIFTGYVLWHPFANKLKRKSTQEVMIKNMMIEGILSVLEGESPKVIESKLASYLPSKEREKLLNDEGESRHAEA